MASVGQDFQPSPCKDFDPSRTIKTGIRGSAAIFWPGVFKAFYLYKFCITLMVTTTDLVSTISATSNFSRSATSFNFSVEGTSYDCSSNVGNVICLGDAHNYTGTEPNAQNYTNAKNSTGNEANAIQVGMLSLVHESVYLVVNTAGIAYYNMPVRVLDPATRRSASFFTSFEFDVRWKFDRGDGMTFVLSESNESRPDSFGKDLGLYNNGVTNFKTIAVEFDMFQNTDAPYLDISDNHVSIDFENVTVCNTADSPEVSLWNNNRIHAWVEYSNETQQLEVRVSYNASRPPYPLLNCTVNLFDVAAEYMWVGFSGANAGESGSSFSNYYVGDWTFESYGIAPSAPGAHKKTDPNTGLIVGMSVPGGVLVLATIFGVLLAKRRSGSHRWQRFSKEDRMQVQGMPERFSYEELSVATRNFSDESKLGEGGFGSVYRGMLPSSSAGAPVEVAVKKISSNSTQGEKEFMAEVSIINQSRHRNLIQLRGWCKDASKRQYLLVYELMSNGSLDKWLFRPAEEENVCLSWPQRFNIVRGIALAVEYLHQGCARQVIHRDIKCSNIMLDENFNVKLGDFGLSRIVDHEDAAPRTRILDRTLGRIAPGASDSKFTQKTGTKLAGTPGYIAPEALVSSKCTDKTDVYAFGVVVLEVACGRKVYLEHLPFEETALVDWVWHRMCEGRMLTVVERQMRDYDPTWMEIMLKVGVLCSHDDPDSRPSMGLVVRMLAGDIPVPPIPPRRSSVYDFVTPNSSDTSTSSRSGLVELASSYFSESTRASSGILFSKNTSSNSNSLISRADS